VAATAKTHNITSYMKTDSFALRHLGPRDQDLPKMLETIGVESLN
jgi:glycine dehydrogenase